MAEPKTKTITDKKPTLKEMQEFVGGYIEVVYAPNGDHIILNEEGKLAGLPINYEATKHWVGDDADDDTNGMTTDYIVGNALILQGKARLT